jgi:hypothetical protein
MIKVIETIVIVVVNAAGKVIEGIQARREKRLPKLDPPLNVLSIEEAVRRAEAQRAYRKAQEDADDKTK